MAELIVQVVKIKDIKEHPNADKLEILEILGWQTLSPKNIYSVGDLVVYVPPDALMPPDLADELGVRNYLAGARQDRVKCIRLRGEMSYGLVFNIPEGKNWEEGKNVTEYYKIIKYESPIRAQAGDAAPEDPLFPRMSDIENMRNFPDVFEEGEEVVLTEKLDGSQSRFMGQFDPENINEIIWKAGSRKVKRKFPSEEDLPTSTYWYPYTLEPVRNLITHLVNEENKTVTLLGEIYGRVRGGHKSMHYGIPGKLGYVAFALKINEKYVDYDMFVKLCDKFLVSRVPVICIMPYNFAKIKEKSTGYSLLATQSGAKHMREGLVIVAMNERNIKNVGIGRSVLKILNEDYLLLKNKRLDKGEVVDFTDV